MTTESKEKVIWVGLPTQDDLGLSERLLQEVGGLHNLRFYLSTDAPTKLNPLIPDYSAGVREMIRHVALQKHGFDWSKWYSPAREEGNDHSAKFLNGIVIGRGPDNKRIFRGKLDDSPNRQHVRALLLRPIHRAYEWYDVAYWNLGLLDTLKTASSGYLVLVNAGVFLFKDEMQKLHLGETVTPKYWGGLNDWGIVEDELDTYQVRDGQLFRVWAHLLD
ncbi:MAG: hypothetical protein AB1643_02985 [Patescibacteria group bacterium]